MKNTRPKTLARKTMQASHTASRMHISSDCTYHSIALQHRLPRVPNYSEGHIALAQKPYAVPIYTVDLSGIIVGVSKRNRAKLALPLSRGDKLLS